MASVEELKEKKQELENDPDVKGNARIARLDAAIENKQEDGQNSESFSDGTQTDTDLDGEKEESPGVAFGGTQEDFETGTAENVKTQELAEQKQNQLESKKSAIESSNTDSFQTIEGETLTKDEALENVEGSIDLAEEIEKQAKTNIETIKENQKIREKNSEIRQANSIAEAERFFNQQALEEQAQENKEKLREQILRNQREEETQEQVTFIERGLNTVEEAGQDLALIADREKDVVGRASEKIGAENVGNDFAAVFETVAGAKPVVEEARSFDTSKPLESVQDLGETGKEEIIDPALTAFTDADEVGLIEPSQDLKERTKDIQGTAASTPLDTAGFLGATGAGLGTITIEQGSRFTTESAREITGDEDLGRDFREGEGLERLIVGTGVLADAVSEKPGEFAQEEITQESTEALVGLGAPTLTVTATPSDLTSRFEGTVRTAGQKAKDTGIKLKDSVTDPNALGLGAGAFLPPETTNTPSSDPRPGTRQTVDTKETVEIDQDLLTGNPDELVMPTASSQTGTATISSPVVGTGTVTEAGAASGTDTLSEPSSITDGRPEALTETQTVSNTPSLTGTPILTATSSTTETPSQTVTDTVTTTPSETITDTPSITTTTTPDIGPGDDENGDNLLLEDEGKGKDRVFSSSVGAELAGVTAEEQPEFFSSPTQLRPVIENGKEEDRESIL